jgi:hypothetical protein
MPTINSIIQDGVRAVGILVAYYYGLAGLVAFWMFRKCSRDSAARWIVAALFPALSGIALIALGAYAMTTFDLITDIIGVGGLLAGIVFFRPRRFVIGSRPT